MRGIGAVDQGNWTVPDARRRLQLALAGIWLLDAVLQFQAFMFSKGFSQMLGATAAGNPAVIATDQLVGQDHRRAWHAD